jgi:hypothetical protein
VLQFALVILEPAVFVLGGNQYIASEMESQDLAASHQAHMHASNL